MALLVLAYPQISKKNETWIQTYRKKYDELYYDVVAPHFTIVFPVFDMAEDDFVKEIETQSDGLSKIEFEIKCAIVNKDAFQEAYHELLVPDKGYSDIVKLHDRLYRSKLFPQLRLDIDFIPHIGIGNTKDALICKKRVDELNQKDLLIQGTIDSLDIVRYENDQVTTVRHIELR